MAYNGSYLVKIGTYEVPLKFIQYNTYSVVWSVNDVDSYRDANGELHRTALDRRTMKVEWQIPPMNNTQVQEFMSNLRTQLNANQKCAMVQAYIPELDVYKRDKCYLTSDVTFQIRHIEGSNIEYEPTRIAFIGYNTEWAK